jgi:hypothetical protein
MAQSLKDSLFGGKLKADTGVTLISKDTGKYVAPKNITVPLQAGEKGNNEMIKPDESMPDSLNKSYYARQKVWKKFIEINTNIISQQADDTKKVRKGTYSISIDYEIGLNGRIKTNGVTCNPKNDFLTEQFTELMKRAPVLSPPIYGDGKPRTLSATQDITVIKK